MRLVIAEKPSVARSLARILNADIQRNGYLEGRKYLVSWCFGHLAGLADADAYDVRYAKWNVDDLPILPEPFRFQVAPDKQEQFELLKSLMSREDVTEVINACDAGREGELIFRTVYYLADCQKPMKRLWISSMEDNAIREGFQNLRPGEEYDGLHESALCRMKADWLVGINATRFFSLLYGAKLNVGRVMSPTLSLLVERQSAISGFAPEKYYSVRLAFEGFQADSKRFSLKTEAQQLADSCKGQTVTVQEIRQQEKKEVAPALYDLTSLQRNANRLLGYTAQQTLDYLQSLYEKQLITYPRTDSRYLTEDMQSTVKALVLWSASVCDLEVPERIQEAQVCDSAKVTDHHAIIPTRSTCWQETEKLPEGERNLLKLICLQVMIATSEAYCYKNAEVTLTCGDAEFTVSLKMPLHIGWKRYYDGKGSSHFFPGLEKGQILMPKTISVIDGQTHPPKPYTEDTLLGAMERAGSEGMPEEAERKGLGTPATRAGILEKLVAAGMVERKKGKKQTILVPTQLGTSLITILPEQLQSPLLTADWEQRLLGIQQGKEKPEDFLQEIGEMLTQMMTSYRPVAGADILFPDDANTVGKCPRCGKPVIERSKGYFCTGRDCKFVLWRDNRFFTLKQKSLDKKTAALLLEKGAAPLKGCVSPKTGQIYDATVLLEDDGERPRFKLVFGHG